MSDFRVTIEAAGGHGCQRDKGDGDFVVGCERPGCPDCMIRECIRRLKRSGHQVNSAVLEHMPADLGYEESSQVTDNLLSGVRTGTFPEHRRYLGKDR